MLTFIYLLNQNSKVMRINDNFPFGKSHFPVALQLSISGLVPGSVVGDDPFIPGPGLLTQGLSPDSLAVRRSMLVQVSRHPADDA